MSNRILVVIGGGAAGFFCSVNAARMDPSLKVILLEKTGKLLSKVRISGGGRCNVTHACFSITDMVKRYPRGSQFLKKAFHQFFTTDTIEWFRQRGVELKTEADGRMFPVTDSSETIIQCLLREANKFGVDIRMNRDVKVLKKTQEHWLVQTEKETIQADHVCVAVGGYPKSSMFQWLSDLGHRFAEPVPSLFTFNIPNKALNELMGVSVTEAMVKIMGTKLQEKGPVLVTHWGLSGPAVLRLSAWGARELAGRDWQYRIQLNWAPAYNENSLREFIQVYRFDKASQKIGNRNPFGLPQRLWDYLLKESGIDPETRWSDLPAREQNKLVKHVCSQELEVKGKTTYKEEFVTAGGIDLSEVDPQTMMSRLHPQLFFAGEILDIDGITGGFNFQNAWTTGFIAAQCIASRS
ncbi:NAD(P)/FAD-dependent oxidoreductase [Flavihumibacter rivuli]|uniref:NAD(P)/FAD-dependent oxidoreductase n=1 Tax=Flavihumibacter rivuli TaxID=2838156 RepID=UPI001BDE3A37|nr:NAD(P)/FAD-dependent oxidoreductase [Flavihumibacter rivuli]ULQ58014.1 NAD(P)/FAD-dependent oxidoreductase [Flavihumibacter rivuli]